MLFFLFLYLWIGLFQAESTTDSTQQLPAVEAYLLSNNLYALDGKWLFVADTASTPPKYATFDSANLRYSVVWAGEDRAFDDYGWYGATWSIPDSLKNKKLDSGILYIRGAADVYINGKKWRQFGSPSYEATKEKLARNFDFFPLEWKMNEPNQIWVRFSNHKKERLGDVGIYTGFSVITGSHEQMLKDRAKSLQDTSQVIGYFIIGFSVALLILHLLIVIQNPSFRYNLAYVAVLAVFILAYSIHLKIDTLANVDLLYWLYYVESIAVIALHLALLLLMYSIGNQKIPLIGYLLLGYGLITTLKQLFYASITLSWMDDILYYLAYAEIARFTLSNRNKDKKAKYVAVGGLLTLIVGLLNSLSTNFDLYIPYVQENAYAGMIFLFISMTTYVAAKITETNRELQIKIKETKRLSDENLQKEREQSELRLLHEQERMRAQIAELEAEAIQKEDQRKSIELEEARKLQLSMIPKELPKFPGYSMAAFIETASEVGGDYYDFRKQEGDHILLALGDATGHGAAAGTMVTATKTLFQHIDPEQSLPDILLQMSASLRLMNFKRVFMSMTLLRIFPDRYEYCAAGMPPLWHFHHHKMEFETITSKGMALGTQADFPYQSITKSIKPHDSLILMSDGLTELMNHKREMISEQWLKKELLKHPKNNAYDWNGSLQKAIKQWRNDAPLRDDVSTLCLTKMH